MMTEHTDILISGGGVAGMMAAACLAKTGCKIICVDPAPPITEQNAAGSDLRSTAFLMPSVILMQETGIWDRLKKHAAPLSVMRLADAGGPEYKLRSICDFVARDVGQDVFGYNFPNWLLRREMLEHIGNLPNVSFESGVAVKAFLARSTEARIALSDERRLSAKLVIGADGRNSFIREAIGIKNKSIRYGQKAIVFAVHHQLPHENISTEIHRTGGPFTLVPLPDDAAGNNRSAVVWMDTGPRCAKLMALSDAAFSEAATERSGCALGSLEIASPRRVWPIISQTAERLTGTRAALIAEAAHVMPPIGAQGLNLSLRDVAALKKLVQEALHSGRDIGSDALLDHFERMRKPDILLRQTGVDLLNRAAMADRQLLIDARRRLLEALHGITPLRQTAMRAGLGLR